jgi:Flp pilus assembly pilin Flp
MHDEQPYDALAKGRLEGDAGANLVEYALLVALIFLVALGAVQFFGVKATQKMSCASSSITNANGTVC